MKAIVALILLSFVLQVFGNLPIIATWYCSLDGSHGNCFPGSCGTYSSKDGYGIAALNPKFYTNASACHYQGSACGTCYALSGPAGGAKIAVTDCCAGYPGNPSCLSDPGFSQCDWCASGDNFHFDLDWDSFTAVCGQAGINAGHCQLNSVVDFAC